MRCFLAVPVVEPALGAGVDLLDRLRSALPRVRWVRSEGLHLTLHFFADLGDDDAARVVAAAAQASVRVEPFTAQLGGLGCFPRAGDERVLWIGMRQGAEATATLQRAVEDALGAAGFAREGRAFTPHVTLGRPRERFSAEARTQWGRFADESLPEFAVSEVLLYRSHLGGDGSRYEVIGRVPLGAGAAL